MTAILTPRDIQAGVDALEALLPDCGPDHLRAVVQAVMDALDDGTECVSVSPFHHVQCQRRDDHARHQNGGLAWVDGAALLKGRYGSSS